MALLLNSVINSDLSESVRTSLLSKLGTFPLHLVHDEKGQAALLPAVKQLLYGPETRSQGYKCVQSLIAHLSSDNIKENYLNWTTICLRDINEKCSTPLKQEACTTLIVIFSETRRRGLDLRDTFSPQVQRLIDGLLNLVTRSSYEMNLALECILEVLKNFPGACGARRSKLEKELLKLVPICNETSFTLIEECFAKIVFCGGGGTQGANHIQGWKTVMQKYLGTINQDVIFMLRLMDPSYSSSFDMEMGKIELFPLEFKKKEDILHKVVTVSRRIKLLAYTISKMLVQQNPNAMPVPVLLMLMICNQLLCVTKPELRPHSIEVQSVMLCIPDLHISAFNILTSLVLSCKKALVLYTGLINDFILRSLVWSERMGKTDGIFIPHLRTCAYDFLSLWCTSMGSCSAVNLKLAEQFYEQIMEDVCLPESESQSRTDVAKKFANNVQMHLGTGLLENLYHPLSNSQIKSAVKAARCCFESSSFLWNLALKAKLGNWAARISLQMSKRNTVSHYLSDSACRIELLQLMLCMAFHLKSASFLSVAQAIFLNAEKSDPDARVREISASALSKITELLHPVRPVFSCTQDLITSILGEGQKEGSEKPLAEMETHNANIALIEENQEIDAEVEEGENLSSLTISSSKKINMREAENNLAQAIAKANEGPLGSALKIDPAPSSKPKKARPSARSDITTTVTLVREGEESDNSPSPPTDVSREIIDLAEYSVEPRTKRLKTKVKETVETASLDPEVEDFLKDFNPE